MQHLRILIRPDGSCTVDAVNFTDATCTQATQQILQALSAQVTQEHLEPEARHAVRHIQSERETAR